MGASRQGKNVWFYLSRRYPASRAWMGWDLFQRRWWSGRWNRQYIWHDSFGQYINRWLVCPLRGHRDVKNIADPGQTADRFCFNCHSHLKEAA